MRIYIILVNIKLIFSFKHVILLKPRCGRDEYWNEKFSSNTGQCWLLKNGQAHVHESGRSYRGKCIPRQLWFADCKRAWVRRDKTCLAPRLRMYRLFRIGLKCWQSWHCTGTLQAQCQSCFPWDSLCTAGNLEWW